MPASGEVGDNGKDSRADEQASGSQGSFWGSSESQLQETKPADIIDEDAGGLGSRSTPNAESVAGEGAPAAARGRAVPAGPGDLVSGRGKSPDGRGKGHSDFEESQDSAFVASLCTQIEQSILNIEQQLNHEARSPHEVANKY